MSSRSNLALIRHQVEDALGSHLTEALSPQPRTKPQCIPCGVPALDDLLHGGLHTGVLTELVGAECSGRTTAALAYTAAVMQRGGVCAWIDVSDALCPESAAVCGVDLERLLWVRCSADQQAPPVTPSENSPAHSTLLQASTVHPYRAYGGSPHPRSEGRNMPQAVSDLMAAHGGLYDKQIRKEKRSIGTPGAQNRPLVYRSEHREEQINSDRLPPRRGDNLLIEPLCAEPQPRRAANIPSNTRLAAGALTPSKARASVKKPWPVLDQALRVADLLTQGGGFSAIVLDLGSVAPEAAWRIPLATWFRFRAACERTRSSLILLTQHSCARSSAEMVVRMQGGVMESENRVMTGIRYLAAIHRNRGHQSDTRVVSIRKQPKPDGAWRSEAAWARA